jgi:hypothetical protein
VEINGEQARRLHITGENEVIPKVVCASRGGIDDQSGRETAESLTGINLAALGLLYGVLKILLKLLRIDAVILEGLSKVAFLRVGGGCGAGRVGGIVTVGVSRRGARCI